MRKERLKREGKDSNREGATQTDKGKAKTRRERL